MSRRVALLRGINLGGRNKVAMADLRTLLSDLGHRDVATYIQSGNVVLTPRDAGVGNEALAAELEREISDRLGVDPAVVVLSCAELAEVVEHNPFADEPDPKAVHAVFFAGPPGAGLGAAVTAAREKAAAAGSRDDARVLGGTLYLHTPDGFGRSDLAAALIRASGRSGQPQGTARNWATVRKLMQMCSG